MCFTVPLRIKKQEVGDKNRWIMEDGRVVRSLVDGVRVGDYLICQQDIGVDRLSKKQALVMRQAIKGVSDEIQTRN